MRLVSSLVVILLCCSCKKEGHQLTPYQLEVPSHFPAMNIPSDNPLSEEGVELGKKLFYDTRLSLDNTISCASCHDQQHAFSDPERFSKGVNGTPGRRNAMALINLGWQNFFFWDGKAGTLEEQILFPVPDPVEMHQEWPETIEKLWKDKYYKEQFEMVFRSKVFDKYMVSKAIAQFLRTLISGSSKYDVMYKIQNGLSLNSAEQTVQITPEEWAGFDLFNSMNGADCVHCHTGPFMQVQGYRNNGLDDHFADRGREEITGNSNDKGKFKTPTLRNIAFTAPYMHDGRFATLDEVIEHYSSGIKQSATIDPMMEFSHQGGVHLTSEEKQYLKAFLLTLSDYQFIHNQKFKNP